MDTSALLKKLDRRLCCLADDSIGVADIEVDGKVDGGVVVREALNG